MFPADHEGYTYKEFGQDHSREGVRYGDTKMSDPRFTVF